MSSRTALTLEKATHTYVPVRAPLSRGPTSARDIGTYVPEAPVAAGMEHDFARIRVHPEPARQVVESCPLGLAAPTACPLGGACHTCPERVQAKLVVNEPGDRYEQEADRIAEEVSQERGVKGFAGSERQACPTLQCADGPAPASDEDRYKEGLKKVGEAFLETPLGKKIRGLAEAVWDTLAGKILVIGGGAAAAGALTAANAPLPAQVPEIPIGSGVSVKVTVEGPVREPSAAYVSVTFRPGAESSNEGEKTKAEQYGAETARVAAELGQLQESMKTPYERRLEQEAMLKRIIATMGIPGKVIPGRGLPPAPQRGPVRRKPLGHARAPTVVPPVVREVLRSPGRPLEGPTRAFMESRFRLDLGQVRVHTDARAAESAQAIRARAYTAGHDVVFGAGEYAPETARGRRLLAHELAHVLQQQGARAGYQADHRLVPQTVVQAGRLQLQREEQYQPGFEAQDPSFLACFLLCFLGLPPSLLSNAVELLLQAAWEEYRVTLSGSALRSTFERYKEELRVAGTLKTMQKILTFAVRGTVLTVPVRSAAVTALRNRMIGLLLRRGATVGGLILAEQIARKAALVTDVAVAAGCATFCGSLAYARTMVEATQAIVEGIASAVRMLETAGQLVGSALTQVFVRPLLVARATVDPGNWELTGMPARSVRHLNVIGIVLWSNMGVNDPNQFASNVTRPLGSYPIPNVLHEIAQDITSALQSRGGFYASVVFTPELVRGLSLLKLVELLRDWRLLRFRRSPEAIADQQLQVSGP